MHMKYSENQVINCKAVYGQYQTCIKQGKNITQ